MGRAPRERYRVYAAEEFFASPAVQLGAASGTSAGPPRRARRLAVVAILLAAIGAVAFVSFKARTTPAPSAHSARAAALVRSGRSPAVSPAVSPPVGAVAAVGVGASAAVTRTRGWAPAAPRRHAARRRRVARPRSSLPRRSREAAPYAGGTRDDRMPAEVERVDSNGTSARVVATEVSPPSAAPAPERGGREFGFEH